MIDPATVGASLRRFPLAAVALYVLAVAACLGIVAQTLSEIGSSHSAAAAAKETLALLEARRLAAGAAEGEGQTSSPFVEGATPALAGAALLQRVQEATRQVGGDIQSSQVEGHAPKEKPGLIAAVFSIELPAESLTPFLYDLEAGMPFLFIDELVVQPAAAAAGGGDSGRLRLVLSLSAQREP